MQDATSRWLIIGQSKLSKILAFGRFGLGKSVARLGFTCPKSRNEVGSKAEAFVFVYVAVCKDAGGSPTEHKLQVFSAPHRTNARCLPKLFRSTNKVSGTEHLHK